MSFRLVAELHMQRTGWTPSIVPTDGGETVYLVAEDFGKWSATGAKQILKSLLLRLPPAASIAGAEAKTK
jgi:hypothetical protein